jgi:hypothetical protein
MYERMHKLLKQTKNKTRKYKENEKKNKCMYITITILQLYQRESYPNICRLYQTFGEKNSICCTL